MDGPTLGIWPLPWCATATRRRPVGLRAPWNWHAGPFNLSSCFHRVCARGRFACGPSSTVTAGHQLPPVSLARGTSRSEPSSTKTRRETELHAILRSQQPPRNSPQSLTLPSWVRARRIIRDQYSSSFEVTREPGTTPKKNPREKEGRSGAQNTLLHGRV